MDATQEAGGYRAPRDQIRWLAVKNKSGEPIPGHALMCLKKDDGNGFYAQEVVRNQVHWKVYKPDEDAELYQDPATLIINGPTPIPIDGEGQGTQDWPAQVLHDGARDGLPNFRVCGPKADEWVVWSGKRAFTCMCHDKAKGNLGTINWPGVHTVWIAPAVRQEPPERVYFLSGSQEIDEGEPAALGNSAGRIAPTYIELNHYSSGGSYLLVKKHGPGSWAFAISATVSSEDADEGTPLMLTLMKGSIGSASIPPAVKATTNFKGYRLQLIEDDQGYQSPFRSAENVAFGGWLDLVENDYLEIQANVKLTADALLFSLWQIGQQPPIHAHASLTD